LPKSRLLAGVATVAALALATPAQAAPTNVDVLLDNPAGSRVLYVEDMAGGTLTSLDFGTARSIPFRVRVVDSNWGRQSFTVNASMTNLYLDQGATVDFSNKIDAGNLTLASQVNPLNVLDVSATVRPIVDTVTTLVGLNALLCPTLGRALTTIGGQQGCALSVNDVAGTVQQLNVPIDLSNLANLPLLPQANESGAFTQAEYGGGVGAGDSAGAGAAGTQRRLIGGQRVDSATVLNALTAAIDSTPRSDLIPDTAVLAGLGTVTSTLSSLTAGQLATVLANTQATVDTLTATDVLSQFGQYIALPALNVAVPAGAVAGDYRGTLVVTGVQ
jgi:hypothetical protein